jgi:GH15 family glucan-1,4-alpha-glucosidase
MEVSSRMVEKDKNSDNRDFGSSIKDYGFISDCHSVALVSKEGSIDWCCMPRIDSSSCFGRLLDWPKGGYCRISPTVRYKISRRYLENSLILETTFHTAKGSAKLIDCFTLREGGEQHPHRQILRILEAIEGEIEFRCQFVPRFDYGIIKPWIRFLNGNKGNRITAIGGSSGLLVTGDINFEFQGRHNCRSVFNLAPGDRVRLSILHRPPEDLDEMNEEIPDDKELDRRLEETIQWWRHWSSKGNYKGDNSLQANRSAVVLKGLCNAPTGAIAASATTSLPEMINGIRNWDYRYSWIRDSVFTLRSLNELGHSSEADGFRRFIERSAAGSAEEIQILYGVGGERRSYEVTLDYLEGYRGSRPVRIGNAAAKQKQFDIFGELLDLAWSWHKLGNSPDDDYCQFIRELVDRTINIWQEPDCGIWEIRDEHRHFVLSKAMCWVALDRAIKLAEDMHLDYPKKQWQQVKSDIRDRIMEKGVDKKRGIFIQAFDYPICDASLLLLPVFGFIDYDDELMVRTTEAIREDLEEDGLLRRYPEDSDGLDGNEGIFTACTFWLVECLAAQGKMEEALKYFKAASATANDLGLFSEEYDVAGKEMLGNFPQGLTHLSHIAAIVALNRAKNKNI